MVKLLYFLFLATSVSGATYFVNPSTGLDANSGLTPLLAWKTAGKVNGATFSSGDVLVIDTSASRLDLSHTNLTLSASGLIVKGTNAPYWTNEVWATLTNSQFYATGTLYAIAVPAEWRFGQSNIVVWEDDKWMYHPNGGTFGVVSNYLAATNGSFWTDGATIFVNPFSGTSPLTDGKTYTRSVARDATGGSSAINLTGTNMTFMDCHAGKTCMAYATTSDGIGAYVIASGNPFGGTSVISNCYLYYGSKHVLGLVASSHDSDITIQNVQAEQATPYATCSALVSFMDGTHGESNNVHRYIGCIVDRPIGLIGSTIGGYTPQSTFLMHNSSSGIQFRECNFDGCRIAGYIGISVCSNSIVRNTTTGAVQPNTTTSNIIDGCYIQSYPSLFNGGIDLTYNVAYSTLIRNCIFAHTNTIQGGQWTGWNMQGTNVTVEFCTIDASGILAQFVGDSRGVVKRYGPLIDFNFRNNVFKAGTSQFSVFQNFTDLDTVFYLSNCVVQLGTSNWFANSFTNSGVATNLTFADAGLDSDMVNTNNLQLNNYYWPTFNSPVIGAGQNLGPMTDFTGRTFQTRNDSGAIEFNGASSRLSSGVAVSGKAVFQ